MIDWLIDWNSKKLLALKSFTKFLRIKKVRTCQQYLDPAQLPDPCLNTHFEQPFALIPEPFWAVQSDKAELRNMYFGKKGWKSTYFNIVFYENNPH